MMNKKQPKKHSAARTQRPTQAEVSRPTDLLPKVKAGIVTPLNREVIYADWMQHEEEILGWRKKKLGCNFDEEDLLVANWRRKVLALFPDLSRDVQRRDFSIYMVFFDLLPRVREAHQTGDTDTLRRVYGFAEWCFEQKAKDMWNAAGVAFYEHLFDSHQSKWREIVQWLSPQVVEGCWGLWEWRLPATELPEVRRLLAARTEQLYIEARKTIRRC